MAEKCKKCFWYFSIRDHRGKVWGRACYHAIDGLLDGQDIQPTEDCFEANSSAADVVSSALTQGSGSSFALQMVSVR